MEKLLTKIKYYEQIITVEVPIDYNNFIFCLSSMLQIPKEIIGNFKLSYIMMNSKECVIKNSEDYAEFLNAIKFKKTDILNIELSNNIKEIKEFQNENIISQKIEDKEKEKEEEEDEDKLNNPYKESFIEDDIKLSEENIKQNSGNIFNNLEDNDNIEFSLLDEDKLKKNEKENNNINKINNINNIEKNNINNINNNINENYIINNKINKNINSYYGQNKLVDNQIRGAPIPVDFKIECNFCKNNKMNGIVFYCKDCCIFFCSNCEEKEGPNHKHCYYKIRNKDQFKEISDLHNNLNNHIKNPYEVDNNSINNNNTLEDKLIDVISEGSKLLENTLHNTYNSVIKFFNLNNTDNNRNNNYINNNNQRNLQRNNNYINNINQRNLQRNNNIQNNNVNDIKSLVEQAKSQYNLEQIGDDEIEKALIISRGNIDKAVALLLSTH